MIIVINKLIILIPITDKDNICITNYINNIAYNHLDDNSFNNDKHS